MACRRIVKLRRGLLLWPLVGPTRATARRASVSSTEVSENRILGSNAYSHCQLVAVENREAIRTTSMMDDCNARALTPMRKSSIAVLSSRLFRKPKRRRWLWKRLGTGFELSQGGPAWCHFDVSSATGQLRLLAYIPDRSKQHGRRFPLASMSQAVLIRRARVSACLAETIQ
jgi:hypothetical protein